MKNYKLILALDPSGNFTEGKGTTGWNLYDAELNYVKVAGFISAEKYDTPEAYWDAHIDIINYAREIAKIYYNSLIVVIEDYVLYSHKAECQINSKMETPKVIGIVQHTCWKHHIPYKMQLAAEVKSRWTNEILIHKGYMSKHGNRYIVNDTIINKHVIDSIRHAVHYNTFKNETRKEA